MTVRDVKDRSKINLKHPAFKQGLRNFEDILSSPNFSDVDQTERLKLFLSAAGERKREDYFSEGSLDSISKIKDPSALMIERPEFQNLGEPKARVRDGNAEFILMTKCTRKVRATFYGDATTETAKDKHESIELAKIKDS